jgi:hypothetical protein
LVVALSEVGDRCKYSYRDYTGQRAGRVARSGFDGRRSADTAHPDAGGDTCPKCDDGYTANGDNCVDGFHSACSVDAGDAILSVKYSSSFGGMGATTLCSLGIAIQPSRRTQYVSYRRKHSMDNRKQLF